MGANDDGAEVLAEYRIDGCKAKHCSVAVRARDRDGDEGVNATERVLGWEFVCFVPRVEMRVVTCYLISFCDGKGRPTP